MGAGSEGVLVIRGGGGTIVSDSGKVSSTVDSSIETFDASMTDDSCCSSSLIVYMSGLGWDDRVLRVDDEGGTSVSSFLLFAEVFASFALCTRAGRLFSSTAAVSAGDSRWAGVRWLER